MKNLIFFIFVLLALPVIGQVEFDYNDTITGDSILFNVPFITGSIKQKRETKKDTVSVDVLFNDGFTLLLQSRKKERTLEYRTVPYDLWVTTKKWAVIEERFIESVDGCYLLHPLFNDR